MNTTLKKRSFSLLLSFVIILSSLPFAVVTANAKLPTWDPFTDSKYGTATNPTVHNPFVPSGKPTNRRQGTSATNPFFLDCVKDLEILAAIVNGENLDVNHNYQGKAFSCSGYYFKLANNIGTTTDDSFKNRIGWCDVDKFYSEYYFNGSFDGCGFTIFVNIFSAESNSSTGLFGGIHLAATVSNVIVKGTVSGDSEVGGVVGVNYGSVANCSNFATVKGSKYVGGVVGYNNGGLVANCSNFTTVTATYDFIGGVVGFNQSGATVANCANYAEVEGGGAGVVGFNQAVATVVNCFNSAKVNGIGGVIGSNGSIEKDADDVFYCYFDKKGCDTLSAIGGYCCSGEYKSFPFETGNVKGLPHDQCVAASGSTVPGGVAIDNVKVPLIDALNAYVNACIEKVDEAPRLFAEGALSATEFTPTPTIDSDKLHGIKLLNWEIDKDSNSPSYNYPILTKDGGEEIDKVNVNMFLAKPAIGCRLLRAKAFSPTKNVRVTHVRTTWLNYNVLPTTKAHLGGKYTAMVSFKLAPAPEYDVADGAKVWVRLNGKLVRATKRGNTYTVACSFNRLGIFTLVSDICKSLFGRIF